MCEPDDWPKIWENVDKHRKATLAKWQSSHAQKWSAAPKGASQYNPEFFGSDPAVRRLELDCVKNGIQIANRGVKRTYYKKHDKIIGVCTGEFTEYVFTEWHVSGAIHGRPISKKALEAILGEKL